MTLSSTEVKYVSTAEVCQEILFIQSILEFLGVIVKYPIIVHVDNMGAIYLVYNEGASMRTKHINVKHHFVHEHVVDGIVKIIFVCSEDNDANIFQRMLEEKCLNDMWKRS